MLRVVRGERIRRSAFCILQRPASAPGGRLERRTGASRVLSLLVQRECNVGKDLKDANDPNDMGDQRLRPRTTRDSG